MSAEEGSGIRERRHSMAIPVDGENPYTCMATGGEKRSECSEDEAPITSVRLKGKGKEIKINENFVNQRKANFPEAACTEKGIYQESDIGFDSQTRPDVRVARKRSHSPTFKTKEKKTDGNIPPLTLNMNFNCHNTTSTRRTPGEQNVPLKKRMRPDSPFKKLERAKPSIGQPSSEKISPELMYAVLLNLMKDGITINGQKFKVKLVSEQESPTPDESYLKQHDFSPGTVDDCLSESQTFMEKQEVDSTVEVSSFMDVEETYEVTSLKTIHEECMPTADKEVTLPTTVQEVPLDLTRKSLDQDEPLDFSTKAAPVSVTDNPLDTTYPVVDTVGLDSSHQKMEEVEELKNPAHMKEDSEVEIIEQDNLPSLTHKTQNLNLDSQNMSASEVPKMNNYVLSKQLLALLIRNPGLIQNAVQAVPNASQAPGIVSPNPALVEPQQILQGSSTGRYGQTLLSDTGMSSNAPSYDHRLGVPNLVDLNMTGEDGTIIRNEQDKLKDKLREKVKKK